MICVPTNAWFHFTGLLDVCGSWPPSLLLKPRVALILMSTNCTRLRLSVYMLVECLHQELEMIRFLCTRRLSRERDDNTVSRVEQPAFGTVTMMHVVVLKLLALAAVSIRDANGEGKGLESLFEDSDPELSWPPEGKDFSGIHMNQITN